MKASTINDTIQYKSKESLVKVLLYSKLSDYPGLIVNEEIVRISDNELNILTLFANNTDKDEVITEALIRKYIRTNQSGENVVTKFVNLGILLKIGKGRRKINPSIFPEAEGDVIFCKLTLYNAE